MPLPLGVSFSKTHVTTSLIFSREGEVLDTTHGDRTYSLTAASDGQPQRKSNQVSEVECMRDLTFTNPQITFVTTQFNVPMPSPSSEIISKCVIRFQIMQRIKMLCLQTINITFLSAQKSSVSYDVFFYLFISFLFLPWATTELPKQWPLTFFTLAHQIQ